MKNRGFLFLLRKLTDEPGQPWTVSKIADAMFLNRSRLNDVFSNKPGHGGNTRGKVVKFFLQRFPGQAPELLRSLGWNERGEITPPQLDPKVAYGTSSST
ncbi:MAG TPA: hypothetical protein VMA35_12475 [Candidatus Sulfopaludibacter sp.]|nr:hypothetical protein [Candidatus Sulfopaludibacter sp.]